ncbi:CLUMA_CG012578, isoform A [Clunio marinus]|uniref:CLUMA_CG012578, isoform A n=1 Tax=Clunio marinus TaxID=568069 RepID=A0A1J1II56_9DIPT|nr:CLUMA_CG012578, isoform A [Clunio marinus]
MKTSWFFFLQHFILIKIFSGSLVDYKACQIKYNCTTTNLNPGECPSGKFLDTRYTNNCCHGCRSGIGRGESGCSVTRANRKCAPGLICDEDFYCILERTSCLHTMHFDENLVGWKPKCEIDGTYSPKQCRGDKLTGRCFCYAEAGERVFGWKWWRNADSMTCTCSRQRYKAEKSGRLDVTVHCLSNGNYEDLQCDMGICWCADESDGHIVKGTFAVPEALWTYLPCYNESFHGDQYLRKCESAAFAQKIAQKKLINRGAINAVPRQIQCNYDGTYGEIIIENPLAFCQMPDGSKLNYAAPSKMMSDMNCNCARDEKIFTMSGIEFNLRCSNNGNYEPNQDQNGKIFCVDRYGFSVSPLLQPDSGLDCDQYIYYAQEDLFFEDEFEY